MLINTGIELGRLKILGSPVTPCADIAFGIPTTEARVEHWGLMTELRAHPKWRYQLIGFVDNDPMCQGEDLLGEVDDLDKILMGRVVDEVIIALPMKSKYEDTSSYHRL
jgi:hypothetical protein